MSGLRQQPARQGRIVFVLRQPGGGVVPRRQHAAGQPRRAAQQMADDRLAVDGMRHRLAHAQVAGHRIGQVETQVVVAAARRAADLHARPAGQIRQQLRRQVVLQQIQFATQELQHPHGRVRHDPEFHLQAVAPALQPYPVRTELPQRERPAAVVVTGRHGRRARRRASSRRNAQRQARREQRIGPAQGEIDLAGRDLVHCQQRAEFGPQRRSKGPIRSRTEHRPIGGHHIRGRQRRAVREVRARLAQCEAPAQGVQLLPVGRRRPRPVIGIQLDQARIDQPH